MERPGKSCSGAVPIPGRVQNMSVWRTHGPGVTLGVLDDLEGLLQPQGSCEHGQCRTSEPQALSREWVPTTARLGWAPPRRAECPWGGPIPVLQGQEELPDPAWAQQHLPIWLGVTQDLLLGASLLLPVLRARALGSSALPYLWQQSSLWGYQQHCRHSCQPWLHFQGVPAEGWGPW